MRNFSSVLLCIVCMALPVSLAAQKSEKNATYKDGKGELNKLVYTHVKLPADRAQALALVGKQASLKMTITEKGKIESSEITHGINSDIDAQLLALVPLLKGWNAAEDNGKSVASSYILSVYVGPYADLNVGSKPKAMAKQLVDSLQNVIATKVANPLLTRTGMQDGKLGFDVLIEPNGSVKEAQLTSCFALGQSGQVESALKGIDNWLLVNDKPNAKPKKESFALWISNTDGTTTARAYREASFFGGERELLNYMGKLIKTKDLKKKMLVSQFDVDASGNVSNVVLSQLVDKKIDAQVLAALQAMPQWLAANVGGQAVGSKQSLAFYLNDEDELLLGISQPAQVPNWDKGVVKYIDRKIDVPRELREKMPASTELNVRMDIDIEGKVKEVKIGKKLNPKVEASVLEAFTGLPTLSPAMHNGNYVATTIYVPITIRGIEAVSKPVSRERISTIGVGE